MKTASQTIQKVRAYALTVAAALILAGGFTASKPVSPAPAQFVAHGHALLVLSDDGQETHGKGHRTLPA